MNNVKKILFVTPSLEVGGAEKVMVTLFNHLDSRKFEGYFFSFKGGPLLSKVKVIETNKFIFNKVKILYGVINLILVIKKVKPNVVFSTHSHLNALICILKKLRFIQTKIIIRESNFLSKQQSNSKGFYESVFITWMVKKFYPSANLLICQTEEMRKDIEYFFPYVKFPKVVIHNPIEFIPKYISSKGQNRIISIGRLEPQKNHKVLIEAFSLIYKKIPHKLFIVGKGSEFDNLQELIRKKGLLERVELVGFKQSVWDLYKNSKLFVLPSNFEGFPNVVIEAMANSTPVISSDCPSGPKEIIKDSVNGILFPVGDVKYLAMVMLRVLEDDALATSLKVNAFESVKAYSPAVISRLYNELFNEV